MLISPVSLLVLGSLTWTLVAKAAHGFSTGILDSPLGLLRTYGSDFLAFGAVGCLLAWLRARWPKSVFLVVPAALLTFVLAGLNGTYLRVAGEQGSWYDILDAIRRRRDLRDVLEDMSAPEAWISAGIGVAVGVALAAGLRYLVLHKVRRSPASREQRAWARAHAWAAVVALGTVISLFPKPSTVQARGLSKNILLLVAKTASAGRFEAKFDGWDPTPWYSRQQLQAWAAAERRPNVLLVILESTRFDHTSLAGDDAKAETPTLARFAKAGFSAPNMRAVLPHTTKSMFSMLCGRYPTMQKGTIETTVGGQTYCLPRALREAGYATFFAQSAFGTFEQRPRLVMNFGYAAFRAFETLRGQKLGYLASEDASLHKALTEWLDGVPAEQPWFATLLTSATHHSYKLPSSVFKTARTQGRHMDSDAERYARLVEAEDRLLRQIHRTLGRTGRLRNTIIIVVGDHGEGFGDQGVKQHDNNYFEEGLRVPFVMLGPGIEKGSRNEADANLLDLSPTLLSALGLEAPAVDLEGHDLRAEDYPADEAKFFGCYDPSRCRGFVLSGKKFVKVPRDDESFWFDLEADPQERNPQIADGLWPKERERLDTVIGAHRAVRWAWEWGVVEGFGEWRCKENEGCRHPDAWKRRHRYDRDTGEDLEDITDEERREAATKRVERMKLNKARVPAGGAKKGD